MGKLSFTNVYFTNVSVQVIGWTLGIERPRDVVSTLKVDDRLVTRRVS